MGREGIRLDCRHFGNGGAGQSAQEAPHRELRQHGQEEKRRRAARTRKQEERKIVLKRANSGVLQQRRGLWERRRVQGEADRCHEARSATPLRLGDDAAPLGAASRGLRSGGRGASERSGGCLSRYSSEAGFRALRELQSSAEAVDLLMRGRVASAGDVLIAQ